MKGRRPLPVNTDNITEKIKQMKRSRRVNLSPAENTAQRRRFDPNVLKED